MKSALINSSITVAYIVSVALFMNWIQSLKLGKDTFIDPIAFISLFVFSAAFTSFWMIGKPVLMYLDGKKKDAVSLISYTLGFFFLYTVIALALLILLPR